MSAATATMIEPQDARFGRMLTWSLGVHVGLIVLAIVVPAEWLGLNREEPQYMTVSLGGGPVGPTTSGTSPVGGKTVEQVVPPPKRPEPVRPTAPPPPPAPAATITKPPPAKPVETPRPAPPTTKPAPATGQQVNQGSARIETGATGAGQGLTSSGQGGLAAELDEKFCCPEWRDTMLLLIDREWNQNMGARGTTILLFTIMKDGRVTDVKVSTPSGNLNLDFEARRTMMSVKLPALPAAYDGDTLTVRLRFPYGGL